MGNNKSMLWSAMSDALAGVDPSTLPQLRVSSQWICIQVLSDPFVVCKSRGYAPVILVEDLESERQCILFVAAKSLSERLEPIRKTRGNLVGLNIKIRKEGDERFSKYEVEELAE